ncbi:MAG: COR domain-containing protein [Acidobacteriota bacterium]|nr:COR domain-containing protein [Acidobacteriota bacterium]
MSETPARALERIQRNRETEEPVLDLLYTDLTTVPPEIYSLTHLRELHLWINRITTIPPELAELGLKHLVLTDNPLEEIADIPGLVLHWDQWSVFQTQLTRQHVVGLQVTKATPLESLPEDWPHLTWLYAADLDLKEIPEHLTRLQNLTHLFLGSNQLKEIPEHLTRLQNLISLNLYNTQLEEIPEHLSRLQNLTHLWLNNNQLKEIPEHLFRLQNLTSLNVHDNPIQEPPPEIVNQGIEAIRNYYAQRKAQGTVRLYESRLLIVGEPGAGKTSLMRKLLDENFNVIADAEDSTTGVNVATGWTFPLDDQADQKFQVNIWDFGGQEIQYATHQFFLSPKALYVLVADDRKQHTLFDYWFNVIQLLGGGSPVLVVLNEYDRCPITNYDHVHFRDHYAGHFNIHQADVDLADTELSRFHALRRRIEELLQALPHVGEQLPAQWKPIRQQLEQQAARNTISLAAYREICAEHKITSEEDQMWLLRYLHCLGVLLHYEDTSLEDTVFLNPRWVLDAVYAVLQAKEVLDNKGRFSKKWLFSLWEFQGYAYEHRGKLLELMLKNHFDLVYRLPNGQYIAPQLLPKVKPDLNWDNTDNLRFRFQYPFIPHGIISRLIVRCHALIHGETVWRQGVVLHKDGARALVEDTVSTGRGDKIIQINLIGPGHARKDLLDYIRGELRSIHSTFPGLEVNEEVPVPQKPDIAVPYNFLLELRYEGQTEFRWPGVSGPLSIETMLVGLEETQALKREREYLMVEKIEINPNISPTFIGSQANPVVQTDAAAQSQAAAKAQAEATSSVDFNFKLELGGLQGAVSELKRDLASNGAEETAQDLADVEDQLKVLKRQEDSPESQDDALGPMNKLSRVLNDLGNKETPAGKALEKIRGGARMAQDLAGKYNKVAEWCGLPCVPSVFLRE